MLESHTADHSRPHVENRAILTLSLGGKVCIEHCGAYRNQTTAQGRASKREWHFTGRFVWAKVFECKRRRGKAIKQSIT
jgi:hypothetical protein